MNINDIKEAKREIIRCKGDFEKAHAIEDKLYYDFIREVSESDSKLSQQAKLVLSTKKIKFARHFS